MRSDIRFAALDEQMEQKLRIAVPLLAAFRIRPQLSPWDGTACNLVVVDSADAYGQRVEELALARGIPVLGVRRDNRVSGDTEIAAASPAASWATKLGELLGQRANKADGSPTETHTAPTTPTVAATVALPVQAPLVCQLWLDHALRGREVRVSGGGRVIRLSSTQGRAYAASHSDLLEARHGLASVDSSWQMRTSESQSRGEVSVSLEVFMLQVARLAGSDLPAFAGDRFVLSDWPDLGGLPDQIAPLMISRQLLDKPISRQALLEQRREGIDSSEIDISLWAFACAGLLTESADTATVVAPPQPAPKRSGLLASISRRFGLFGFAR